MSIHDASQTHSTPGAFAVVAPNLGRGMPLPPGWTRLADLPLTVLVGLTGVGKSTTLHALADQGATFDLLPNRRELTDWLIIAAMQELDGEPAQPVTDRTARFAYTRRYRERFPGGMVHALAQLSVDPAALPGPLLFDGLRGVDEVTHAVSALPHARFVVLHAPDHVRVERLLGRNDLFDRVAPLSTRETAGAIRTFADIGMPGAAALFDEEQARSLLDLVHQGDVAVSDMAAKLKIVVEERRNYDPDAALAALADLASARTLIVDTTLHTPAEAAGLMTEFLQNRTLR